MPADQRRDRLLHQRHVERPEKEAGAPFHQRRAGGIVVQHVVIGTRTGAEAGVEKIVDARVARQFLGPAHGDRGGQEGVHAAHPGMDVARQGGIEMHHLFQRMHAGVGAAGAGGGQAHAGEFLQRVFQLVLHRQATFLLLVAMPGQPVILQAQGDALQGRGFNNILHCRIIPASQPDAFQHLKRLRRRSGHATQPWASWQALN